jgi:hypothetical protein
LYVHTFAAALLAASAFVTPVRAEGPAVDAPVVVNTQIGGHWTGAKLRCQKEVGKLVRCGTPSAFEITFADDGTGSTPDENLPQEFTWRWLAATEIAMQPKAGGEEFKLFAVEQEEEESILTFQAYVYQPTADPTAPAEARYIHYVFDVNRDEEAR